MSEIPQPVDKSSKLDVNKVEQAVSLFMDGYTIADIARACNVSRQTIYRWRESREWANATQTMQSDDCRAMVCRARAIVRSQLGEGDLRTAKWLLARVDPLFWDPRYRDTNREDDEDSNNSIGGIGQLSASDLKKLIHVLQDTQDPAPLDVDLE